MRCSTPSNTTTTTVLSNKKFALKIHKTSKKERKKKKKKQTMKKTSSPPPWQVLDLVAHRLDPETLAAAACVSKSWSHTLSADHLWQPICAAAFPSLLHLHLTAAPSPTPYHRLYSLGRAAAARRLRRPPKPLLSLHDLTFAVDVHAGRRRVATAVVHGGRLEADKNGVFRFDVGVEGGEAVALDEVEGLRVTWHVVLEGMKGVFVMMDCSGKGSFVLGLEGWFSKELPPPGCCSGGGGLVADLRVGLREGGGGGRVVVEKVSVGVLSVVSWRYVSVDDALRYLQWFLL